MAEAVPYGYIMIMRDGLFENKTNTFIRHALKLPHSIKPGVMKQAKPVLN